MIRRFDWERELKKRGPKGSTIRHVLLTLATHVHRKDAECWPTVRLLAEECDLSVRSVIDQLEIAAKEGWIKKKFARNDRMKHAGQVYTLTLPSGERPSPVDRGRSGERPSPVDPTYPQKLSTGSESGEPDAASGERRSMSGERRSESGEVENCKPLNSETNFSQTEYKQSIKKILNSEALNFPSLKGKTEKKSENPKSKSEDPKFKDALQWGAELGVQRFAGELDGAYGLRVWEALQAHRAKAPTP